LLLNRLSQISQWKFSCCFFPILVFLAAVVLVVERFPLAFFIRGEEESKLFVDVELEESSDSNLCSPAD
jgi:hypothetical protein